MTLTAGSALLVVLMVQSVRVEGAALPSTADQAQSVNASDLFTLPTAHFDDVEELLGLHGRLLASNVNSSVNPCENFYEYACGNWQQSPYVPAEARNDTFLHSMQLQIDKLIQNYLANTTDEVRRGEANSAETKAKLFYHTCLSQQTDTARGYRQLWTKADADDRLLGPAELNATKDWIYVNFMSQYEMFPLLPLQVHYNTEQRKLDVMISPPRAVLSDSTLVDVKNLTREFKLERAEDVSAFEQEFASMVQFEKNLTAHAVKRNETEQLRLGEFLKLHREDKLNWTRYFELAFNGTQQPDWLVLNNVQSVDALARFLQRTAMSTLQTYVRWRVLLKFYAMWHVEGNKTAANICRDHTEQFFNYALLPWFIETHFDADRRADILLLAKQIKQSFYELIERYTWLDDETKSHAKSKLTSMDVMVGYSDEMQHRESIDAAYVDLNLTTDWFSNLEAVVSNRARVRLRSVHRSLIPSLMSTRSVNAYYADFLNLAHITIGIAQSPFYDIRLPDALKFGGIGNIIAHEMAHGFDTYCYQYNFDGKKMNWWSTASLRNFRERYQCLESQYNKYIMLGVQTNGNQTSGDNIADNVGLRLAYLAYMQGEGKTKAQEKPIRELDYTNKQLFFLKFAQSWCSGKDDAYKIKRIKTDVHAYDEFRVVGTLSNMPEFSEAFKCKLGSDMNPLKKCVVW